MKLVLPIPPDWESRAVADGVMYQAPSQIFGMLVMPIIPRPEDPEAWIQQCFAYRSTPDDGPPRNPRMTRRVTADGWGVVLVEGELGTQSRLVAYLAFLDYAATVIGMCRHAQAQPTWRDEVVSLVLNAQPDFSHDRVPSLAQLLGGPPPPVLPSRKRPPMVGWQRGFAGGDVVLTPPEGPTTGTIRVSSHVTPIRTVEQIFAPLVDSELPAIVVELPSIEITDEGEYAAIAKSTTPTTQHTLCTVFGDDHYTQIEAVVRDPEQFETFGVAVRELMYATTLGLGLGRWRRFYYEPPRGWLGVTRQRGAVWIAPTCGRQHQLMRVFDARPAGDHEQLHGARMFETLPMEFFNEPPKGPVSYWTADDHECQVTVYRGRLEHRSGSLVVLDGIIVTDAYVYPIRMECASDRFEDSMQVFEQVVASVRLLPGRRSVDLNTGSAVQFWAG